MIEKMKAALLYGVRDVRVEETAIKQPETDQALIKDQSLWNMSHRCEILYRRAEDDQLSAHSGT